MMVEINEIGMHGMVIPEHCSSNPLSSVINYPKYFTSMLARQNWKNSIGSLRVRNAINIFII